MDSIALATQIMSAYMMCACPHAGCAFFDCFDKELDKDRDVMFQDHWLQLKACSPSQDLL